MWMTAAFLFVAGIGGPQYLPTVEYQQQTLRGWTVRIHPALPRDNPQLAEQVLSLLDNHLFRITLVVPPAALEELRKIPIWVESQTSRNAGMCYHPSRQWLAEHGYNPDKAGSIELENPKNFLGWFADQPWMVLHEMAHGYHHRILGYDHAGIRRCFERAVQSGKYDSVLHINGRTERHYALNNDQEYFAEATEAFFGTNDFYPFVRAELRQHDPDLFDLMESLWKR
jgi:hypothetical protein